jgi:putative tryptophan/tyrosine transport system substrate-binding protein
MRRRDLIIGLCGTLAAYPVAAVAERMRRIGVLAQDIEPGLMDAFRDQLQKLGYIEGKNVTIELRNADGKNALLPKLAQELLREKSEVIVAVNTPAAQAAKKATTTVPVVMMRIADPVKSGIVTNLARPDGNITGLSFMPDALGPKGVELLTKVYPNLRRMAALYQGNNPGAVVIVDEVVRRGEPLGLQFVRLPVQSPNDYEHAFEVTKRANSQALFVMDDGAITKHRREILDLAAKHGLPVVSIYRDFAAAGGLISYGPNLDVVYRRAADYVAKLLKGARAEEMPIEQPVRFTVVINLRSAKALGLDIPQSALIVADEVIE